MTFNYQLGLDGKIYVVFKNNIEAEYHEHLFVDCHIASFGQYENAYCVQELWGQ